MKKILCLTLALILCFSTTSALADIEGTVQGDIMLTSETSGETLPEESKDGGIVFTDVVADTALGEAIYKMVSEGIVAGYPDGTFRPNSTLTRAELSKMINLVFDLKESASELTFTDVTEDDWYYSYVLVAVKAGYIKGFEDNTFRGDDPVTREQVCAILNRITTAKGLGLFDLPFTDNILDEVSDWALEDVKKIIANYVMPLENGKFRATENITRAELALALDMFVVPATKYTVTFDTKGGSNIEKALVKEGEKVSKPKDPEKKNNTFKGWFTDEKFKTEYKFDTAVIKDITLYAKWEPVSTGGANVGGGSYTPPVTENPTVTNYAVTFDSKGGTDVESQTVASGSSVVEPDAPAKDLHIFMGWYTDSACTKPYDFSSAVTKSFTLYALWQEDEDAIREQRVSDLTVIKNVMNETDFSANPFYSDIKDMTLETLGLVVADGEAGINISEDYVAETYGDRIAEARAIYDADMVESERDEFKEMVTLMIAECRTRGLKMTLSEVYLFIVGIEIEE